MTRLQTRLLAVCAELLWWVGLAGLIVQSITGGLSVGVLMLLAMVLSLRLFCAINGMTIKALLRLVQKHRKERQK